VTPRRFPPPWTVEALEGVGFTSEAPETKALAEIIRDVQCRPSLLPLRARARWPRCPAAAVLTPQSRGLEGWRTRRLVVDTDRTLHLAAHATVLGETEDHIAQVLVDRIPRPMNSKSELGLCGHPLQRRYYDRRDGSYAGNDCPIHRKRFPHVTGTPRQEYGLRVNWSRVRNL
jgi:hypothetical protein